jgi:predicted amidohydrolase
MTYDRVVSSGNASVRIGVVQQDANPGDVLGNRRKALRFAAEALAAGAEIIVFPEEMLVGYVENVRGLAEPAEGPTTRAFTDLLRGSAARVLYGLTESDGERLYISAALVGGEGLIELYRKTHLWWRTPGLRDETAQFTAGDRLVTFDVAGHPAGVMICYDGDFPEMTRAYANRGAEMLFWLNHRESRGHDEVRPLAVGNSMIIAAACVSGTDEAGQVCRGGSNVTDADGSLLAEIWDREGVIVADVSPQHVSSLRRENPWFTGQRPSLYTAGT